MIYKKIINLENLRGDFFGGLTAAVVALPLALAFGLQSGLGAISGLYGAMAIGIIAAWFGGTATQISGPTGPMTVVSAVIISTAIDTHGGSLEAAMGSILAIFLLAGCFQILLGMFKVGQYIHYIPYPVVSGFMSGIGGIIIVLQIFPFLGHTSPKKVLQIFSDLPNILPAINLTSVAVSTATIATIYLFPRITKLVPSALVALIAITIFSTIMELDVGIIGDIPEGLPVLQIDALAEVNLSQPMLLIIPALTLAALGTIDSLLTSIVADNMTKTQHNSNKELIGQGLGNMGAALIGGIPGAGATMRTVVNINSGGKTRISGIIHGLALLIVLLGAGAYARLIPLPVLAGILITVGIGIIDYKGIKHIFCVPKTDSIIMLVVLTMTIFVDLLQAVAVGLIIACILFMKKMSDIVEQKSSLDSVGHYFGEGLHTTEIKLSDNIRQQVYIQRFEGPIFFGFVSKMQQMMNTLPPVTVVIMCMKQVPYIDQSGLYAIEEAVIALKKRGIILLMSGIQAQAKDSLESIGLIGGLIAKEYLFENLSQCMLALETDSVKATPTSLENIVWKLN